ncbi:hypothetical protein, partial [Nocardia brasiliensis]|uniref:hypothetical protein n=1 Tax=Nocardia brasiliensis TaxID=37326 RepID=UPI002458FFDD
AVEAHGPKAQVSTAETRDIRGREPRRARAANNTAANITGRGRGIGKRWADILDGETSGTRMAGLERHREDNVDLEKR